MAKIQQEQEDTLRKTVERDEQINKLKADLNTSAHHQATLKKDHESKMAEQRLRIAKQESEIGKLRAELKATNATNQDQASKLKSFERMIVEKEQLIGSQKVDIENIKAALNASNQQHEETLSQYEQKIQEKEDSIVLKQTEVNKLNRDLKELKAANCVEMKEKDRKIIKELRKKERVIEELQQQMDNEIIENNRLNAESENIIADLNASNQQHKETLSQYKQKIQEKEDSIVLKQQQMDNERIENNRQRIENTKHRIEKNQTTNGKTDKEFRIPDTRIEKTRHRIEKTRQRIKTTRQKN